jgi:hypothetical protein
VQAYGGRMPRLAPMILAAALLLVACAADETPGDPTPNTPASTATPSPALPEDGATEPSAEPGEPSATSSPSATEDPRDGAVAGGEDEVETGWERLSDAPVALTEVAAAPFAGDIWTAGGLDADGSVVSDVLVYEPTFDVWEHGPPLLSPRHHAAMVSDGQRLHLLGGYTDEGFGAPTDEVLVLDQATGEWTEGPALPEARAAGAAAWDGSRIVYGGGVGPDGVSDAVWALESGGWEQVGSLSAPREHLAGASDAAGTVWFLGGRSGGLDSNSAAVDVVRGGEVWALGELPTARGGLAGLHLPGLGACALGGEQEEGTFAEAECIDDEGSVTTLPPLAVPRHGLGAVVVEGVPYSVLGGPEPGLHVSPALEALRGVRGPG